MTSPTRLYVLFSLPKSGAQAFASALDAGFTPKPFGKHYTRSVGVPNGLHAEMPIRRELAAELSQGGWLHTHAAASFATVDALNAMGARYLVMIRHPLDQIAAFYCHVVKYLDLLKAVPGHPDLIYSLPMAPLRREFFAEKGRIDEALTHLVRDGYLETCLRWVADWLYWRDPAQSRVVRYEDFIQSPSQTLWQAQSFLPHCIAFDGDRLARALDALGAYRQSSYEEFENRSAAYPRGWTGSIGICSEYLTTELRSEAAAAVRRFAGTYPHGHLVSQAYPEFAPTHEDQVASAA